MPLKEDILNWQINEFDFLKEKLSICNVKGLV